MIYFELLQTLCKRLSKKEILDFLSDNVIDWIESDVKLKPCPICGGNAEIHSTIESWVECNQCRAKTDMKNCTELAIVDWQLNHNITKNERCINCLHIDEDGSCPYLNDPNMCVY